MKPQGVENLGTLWPSTIPAIGPGFSVNTGERKRSHDFKLFKVKEKITVQNVKIGLNSVLKFCYALVG